MSRPLAVTLCAIVLLSVILQQVSCHGYGRHHRGRYYNGQYEHHGHHGHHRRPHHWIPPPNIDIYSPKGIEVSVPRLNATSQYFAFEMFINNPDGDTPDVKHNTTELVYGKFMVQDTEVIIRQGDALNVTTYMGFTDGGVLKHTFSFHVFRFMIKNNCTFVNGTQPEATTKRPIYTVPPWTRTTRQWTSTRTAKPTSPTTARTTTTSTTTSTTTTSTPDWTKDQVISGDYSDEDFDCVIDPTTNLCSYGSLIDERSGSRPEKLIAKPDRRRDVLEGIVEMVAEQCVATPRTNLLILDGAEDAYDPTIDWIGNVRAVLKQLPRLGKLADSGLVSAGRQGKVVLFQMDTLLNKLHVLYQAREAGIKYVKDFDDVKIVK